MKTIKFLLHSLSVSDLPHPSHERQYRKIVGRVVDGRTDAPLSIVRVELWDAERLEGPVAVTQTDESGAFQLDLEELFLESQPALLFRLYGEGWTGTLEVSSEALDGRGDELEIAVEPPTRPAEVPAPTPSPDEVPLAALNAENDLGLSDDLLERLHSEGINTLADVRTAGDLAARPGLSKANRVRLRVLAAHADLALISPDIATNARLIGAGFDGVRAIAATPRADFVARIEAAEARAIAATPPAEFVARTEAVLGEARATDLHRTAVAGDMLLHNYAIAARVDGATDRAAPLFPDPWPFPIPWPLPPERCACDDCDATTSPRAYLADLINYALDHLRSVEIERVPLYRLRSPSGGHFYTSDPIERDWAIRQRGYRPESVACYVFPRSYGGPTPLYRLFRQANGDYLYTTSAGDRDTAVANNGYRAEGIACYVLSSPDPERVPLFRLLLSNGTRFYTTSTDERSRLLASGATDEGVACYVFTGIGRALKLDQLADLLLQPLAKLPASCQATDEQVRQVRICIEVLRAYQRGRLLPDADVDPSLLPWPIKFAIAGDVDGDGRDELIIAPAWEYAWYQNIAYQGNGFWVLKYDPQARRWRHLSPIPGHRFEADVDPAADVEPTAAEAFARFAVAADVDGDQRAELIIAVDQAGEGRALFWAMDYDPVARRWSHLSDPWVRAAPSEPDFACSSAAVSARFAFAADVDGDGSDEIVAAPQASGADGNSFWVMQYDRRVGRWRHLSPIAGHSFDADLICYNGPGAVAAKFALAADVDGDGSPEIVANLDGQGGVGAYVWVMDYTPGAGWQHLLNGMVGTQDADADLNSSSGNPVPSRFVVAADIDQDGQAELIAVPEPDPRSPDPNAGYVYKYQLYHGNYTFVSIGTVDCSTSTSPWAVGLAADVAVDKRDEVIGLPDPGRNPQAIGAWAMDYDQTAQQWRHLSPMAGHPFQADVVWSKSILTAAFALAADVDGDKRAELVLGPSTSQFNELWVMDYDPAAGAWQHLSPLSGTVDRAYALAAYQALLTGIGTTYDELRLAAGATLRERELLAERLGVPVAALAELLLPANRIDEVALEKTFGLPSTTSLDPLAPLKQSILEQRRGERLAAHWLEQDWPDDPYTAGAIPIIDPDLIGPDDFRTPIIKLQPGDPDGAFDVWARRRAMVDQELARLQGVPLRTVTVGGNQWTGPDLAAILALMQKAGLDGSPAPWPAGITDLGKELTDLHASIVGTSAPASAAQRIDDLDKRFFLTSDALARLVDLRVKDRLWAADPARSETVSDGEWAEVRDILVQARKRSCSTAWIQEETALQPPLRLGPEEFWPALREPEEGTWPPERTQPLIDPDRVGLRELPGPDAGDRALALWHARRREVDDITHDLRDTFDQTGDVEQVLAKAFKALGHPPTQPTWRAELAALRADLIGDPDPKVNQQARTTIENQLKLTVEQFTRLSEVVDRAGRQQLKAVEWADLYAILTAACKQIDLYPTWSTEEQPIPDWALLRPRLPRWRAPATARQSWVAALRFRSSAPLIDPDLIGPEYVRINSPALVRWRERDEWLNGRPGARGRIEQIRARRESLGSSLTSFDTVVVESLFTQRDQDARYAELKAARTNTSVNAMLDRAYGPDLRDLDSVQADLGRVGTGAAADADRYIAEVLCLTQSEFALLMRGRAGHATATEWAQIYRTLARAVLARIVVDLGAGLERDADAAVRLDQLGLTRGACARLTRMRALIVAGQSVLASEWDEVYAILVQAEKRRRFAAWRDEERTDQISRSPNFFQLPERVPGAPLPALPTWRADPIQLLDWSDALQARFDEEQNLAAAQADLISGVEERMLPRLRDGLLMELAIPAGTLAERAAWVTEHLLIDAAVSGCQKTTRVEQAIESLQVLLWSIRTGQLADTHPELRLQADSFDEDWKWMGSYATWRSALLVFLYPENILQPTLRRRQSLAFRELVDALRGERRLSPARARRYAAAYGDYFDDLCRLNVEACQTAETPIFPGSASQPPGTRHRLNFVFGTSAGTNQVYWCMIDTEAGDPQDAQSFWARLDAFKDPVIGLVGAAVQEKESDPQHPEQQRLLYLFAQTEGDQGQKLVFLRYQLESGVWDSEATELEPPKDVTSFRAWLRAKADAAPPGVGIATTISTGPRASQEVTYIRSLNRRGTGWECDDFRRLSQQGTWFSMGDGSARPLHTDLALVNPANPVVGLRTIVAGDFDGNKQTKLLVGDEVQNNDPVWENDFWLLDYRGGGWQAVRNLSCSNQALRAGFAVVGDFDNDKYDEVAIAIDPDPNTGAARNNDFWVMEYGPSGWAPLGAIPGHPADACIDCYSGQVPAPAKFAVAGDFDGDGYAELAIAIDTEMLLPVFTGVLNYYNLFWVQKYVGGAWQHQQPDHTLLDASFHCCSDRNQTVSAAFAVAGDFDGDGRAEIAVACTPGPGDISRGNDFWVKDYRDGQWQDLGPTSGTPATSFDLASDDVPAAFAVAGDFDGDGRAELAIGPYVDVSTPAALRNMLWVARFTPGPGNDPATGSWAVTTIPNVSFANGAPAAFAVAGDFDGDGRAELAIAPFTGSDMLVADYDPDPSVHQWTIAAPFSPLVLGGAAAGIAFAVAGNFEGNSDGRAALAVAPGGQLRISISSSTAGTNLIRRYQGQAQTNLLWLRNFVPNADPALPQGPFNADTPVYNGPPASADPTDGLDRRLWSRAALLANQSRARTIQAVIEEAFYFVPLQIALQLQQAGQYTAALDWFRTIYDYSRPLSERKRYYGLVREETLNFGFSHAVDWLRDPLNPHAIAITRALTYTRFTLQALVRCLLDYADAEFTRDTGEALARARTLYMTALELLESPELQQRQGTCEALIGRLEISLGQPQLARIGPRLRRALAAISDVPNLTRAVDGVIGALNGDGAWPNRVIAAERAIATARAHPAPTIGEAVSATNRGGNGGGIALLRRPDLAAALTNGVRLGPDLDATPRLPAPSYTFCVPANPVLRGLRMRAELNLFKLRDCRNIAGARRALEIYAAPTDTTSGLPTIGPGGQLTLPGAAAIPPTPYRYSALIERAKQLAQQAAQVEAALLSALEKRDAEAYQLLKARQDVRVARAGVRLQELRVREAESGIRLAELQRDRAQIQFDRYQSWIDEGESTYELEALFYMEEAFKNQHIAATLNFAAAATYGLLALEQAGAAAVFSSIPLQQQAAVSYGLGAIGSLAQGLSATSGGYSGLAAAASTRASILATRASYERHRQEWELARDLARQDIAIGDQQVRIAEDHVRVNEQERLIAELQTDNAERTVDFLAGKFTNVDLYDWMSDILAGVYRFLLQQATGMARLAAGQLAFERQEPAPPYIQDDYWEAPSDGATLEPGEGQGPDRRGLTGSARLLRDIVQLDQYAFETNRRKLQLTKVVSLAQFAPVEFQRFRESGVLNFSLPLELFDRDFPGHYLRLIRRVRLSMVALIPPTQGIKAAVTSTGISRVVVGGDVYQRIVLRREPESVALTSPLNASGIFELEPASPELNLPFEWSGVDMGWELRLPQAANLFDYRTIADVLMTLEYTALDSFDYRQQVQQALQSTLRAERPFSFRQELVDAWYDLHNPDQTAEPMTVRFTTTRDDFPPNLTNLRVQHLAFYIARAAEQEFELPITALRFTEGGTGGSVGGGGLTTDGLISTRRGNAGGWTAIQGKEPVGTWELVLPNTATVREHFAAGHITDLLLVITYSGRTPSWPA